MSESMKDKELIQKLHEKAVKRNVCTPLEMCWTLRNYVGTLTGRYDLANEIGATFCDIISSRMKKDKMTDIRDDECSEFWNNTKNFLIGGR